MPTDNSIVKRVLRNYCTLYDTDPTYTGAIQKLLEESDYISLMQEAYEQAVMTGEVAIRPVVYNGKLEYRLYTPDQLCIFQISVLTPAELTILRY